jgi:membrane associated rhomboid family serine protease
MLPIRDTVPTYTFPITNVLLIFSISVGFLLTNFLPDNTYYALVSKYGLVADSFQAENILETKPLPKLLTLFTHVFLHGGWIHFLSNIWTLYIFGDTVEDRMGSKRYLSFFLISGVISGLMQVLFIPGSKVPIIGASGAIASVLGAYFVMYPRARVVTLIFIFFIPWFVKLPALLYLGLWFTSQVVYGLSDLGIDRSAVVGGVAWWAHIGGFLFGMFFYRLFIPRVHPALEHHRQNHSITR